MIGNIGNTIFSVDDVGDSIGGETADGGVDSVYSRVSYTLGDHLEKLFLNGDEMIDGIGNELDNVIRGNAGNNNLNGGDGDDTLYAGLGTDYLYGGNGNDTLDGGDVAPAGMAWVYLYGEAGSDTLTAKSKNSVLWGGAGNDHLYGGTGNNYLFGDDGDDVLASGSGTILLMGGNGNDQLTGADGAESLYGGAGDDVLLGGAGADSLYGNQGSDTYQLARGDGADLVKDYDPDGSSFDIARYGADIRHDQLWFQQVNNDLFVSIIGTNDQVRISGWYQDQASQLDAFHAGDGYVLLNSQVEQLVQAMAGFQPPASGELDLTPSLHAELDPVISANWQAA